MTMFRLLPVPLLLAAAAPDAPVTVAAARTGMAGTWAGKLEYRDYRADRWFGIPVVTVIEAIGDGRTLIRKSAFDDGPRVGTVHITGVALYDPAAGTETSVAVRAGKTVEPPSTARLRLAAARDATHWTLVEERDGTDDDRPARIRETTVRDGERMTTLKEVDFSDDAATTWLSRNRRTLVRR
ncbi:hypothetical protein ASG29_02010 [Sphingomonas sp. Leaf412]|uniref:hypothetical protein n=1 Tax=Sphingomonas sp. Leaf412 TaxID=1736370 RepID=UPI0006F45E8C|nr:hypothetical protein [Sphingomonas sp. Leaf412]KQT34945.1 hypothetical protein ASG29_02010 [Sphingomonas sp. Leaf412]